MGRELFAHDLAHDFLSDRLLGQSEVGLQRIIDESLIPLSRFLGLSLEAREDCVVNVDRDARFPGCGNHRATFALGEVIHLFHNFSVLWDRPSGSKSADTYTVYVRYAY